MTQWKDGIAIIPCKSLKTKRETVPSRNPISATVQASGGPGKYGAIAGKKPEINAVMIREIIPAHRSSLLRSLRPTWAKNSTDPTI